MAQVSRLFDDYNCMRLINNRMACSGNLVKIALGQLKNVKIALATLRQFFYIFHLTLSNFPQIALQSMRLLVLIVTFRLYMKLFEKGFCTCLLKVLRKHFCLFVYEIELIWKATGAMAPTFVMKIHFWDDTKTICGHI